MSRHTPESWRVSRSAVPDGVSQHAIYRESDGRDIAIVKEARAVADLMAAAPRLLDTLLLAESALDTYRVTGAFAPGQPSGWLLRQIREAVSLAERGDS